jgi:hypothetical protein
LRLRAARARALSWYIFSEHAMQYFADLWRPEISAPHWAQQRSLFNGLYLLKLDIHELPLAARRPQRQIQLIYKIVSVSRSGGR